MLLRFIFSLAAIALVTPAQAQATSCPVDMVIEQFIYKFPMGGKRSPYGEERFVDVDFQALIPRGAKQTIQVGRDDMTYVNTFDLDLEVFHLELTDKVRRSNWIVLMDHARCTIQDAISLSPRDEDLLR